ncbi:hypothetical protein OTU49_006926, partial [Cherax quadricarinatus]
PWLVWIILVRGERVCLNPSPAFQFFHFTMQWMMQGFMLVIVMVGRSTCCQYWCKTPPPQDTAYCCSLPDRVYPAPEVHSGSCPPARKVCPRIQLPEVCPHDGACPQNQKCCWDVCLELHTCKPSHKIPVELPKFPSVAHLARSDVSGIE